MKKITTSIIASIALSMIIGCGEGGGVVSGDDTSSSAVSSSSSTPATSSSATISDSKIIGLDYVTSSGYSGVTDSEGNFTYLSTDANVTFKVGELKIATFNLHNLKSDKTILVGELFGLDRNNTTDPNLLKAIRFLQTIDDDNNPDNGIYISNDTKDKMSNLIDINTSVKINLVDNNLSALNTISKLIINKKLTSITGAKYHYRQTLKNLGVKLVFRPFETVWNITPSDKIITIKKGSWRGDYDFNYTIDWGDGTIEGNVTTKKNHIYAHEGNYTVKITGIFPAFMIDGNDTNQLIDVKQWGDIHWKSLFGAFTETTNLIKMTATDIPDLSGCIDISSIFSASNFNGNINNWEVSNIKDMGHMFYEDSSFNQPLDKWDTSNVTLMYGMFYEASSFNQPLDKWDTSKVKGMSYMFYGASSFNQPLNEWNTSNVTNMSYMFDGASSFNQSINRWNTSNVTDMSYMFANSSFNQILPWDTSNVKKMGGMFKNNKSFNQYIGYWDVSNVEIMYEMFENTNFAGGGLDKLARWDTSKVHAMQHMFYNNNVLEEDFRGWNVDNVYSHGNFKSDGNDKIIEPNWKH